MASINTKAPSSVQLAKLPNWAQSYIIGLRNETQQLIDRASVKDGSPLNPGVISLPIRNALGDHVQLSDRFHEAVFEVPTGRFQFLWDSTCKQMVVYSRGTMKITPRASNCIYLEDL